MAPGESLAPWVLLLEQESYLSEIKKGGRKDIANYRPISLLSLNYKIHTRIHKSRMQKTLDTMIGKTSQLLLKIEKFYILFLLFVT